MSYNTRRTGAAGRGGPTTQVNYHQQPGRTVGGAVQSRNPGYSTTNSQSTYNSSAQPAFSTQAGYTTAPPLPAQTPKSQPPATAAPQPPTPAQTPSQKPQQPPPQKPPVTPQPTVKPETQPTPQRTVKPEPPPTPQSADTSTTSENGDGGPKPFWKKKPFVKVSNKIRKARQNAKLRRILNPKNALTFLNELRPGGVKFVIREEPGWGFVASVDIDGKTYSGHALTVSKAKVQASEQALKSVLLEQLSKAQSAVPPAVEKKESEVKQENENEPMDTNETTSTEEESAESKSKKKLEPPLEDEMPWGSLAAFALHKLFAEWQKDGTESHAPPLEKYEDEIAEEAYFSRRPVPPPPEFGYPRRFVPGGVYRGGRGYAPYPPRGGPPPPGFGPIIRRPPPPPASTFLTQGAPKPALPLTAASSMMPMKKIPDDANKRHPVMILNQLKPNVIYTESREGQPPHVVFIITVELDGKEYVGRGKSKKDAKKSAAKAALAPLGIIYDDEN